MRVTTTTTILLHSPLLLILFLAVSAGEGVRKRWVKNWNLDTPSNWKDRGLPCAGKAAILPRYPSNLMFVGGDLTLSSLELPVEGEVIFGVGTHIILDHNSGNDACRDAEWSHHGEDEWWDPDAWSYPGYEDTAYAMPVPDLHRPPCPRDAAVFPAPADSLYTLTIAPPTVYVTTLSVGDKNYSTSEIASYMSTTEGRARFRVSSTRTDGASLYIESPGQCADMTGCLCGSESTQAVICKIKSAKCPKPHCDKPLDMTGFCCPVCGAEVTISHNGTLPLVSVETLLKTHRKSHKMRGVKAYLAKMKDRKYHVYFTASSEDGNYRAASDAFKVKFNQELNSGSSHQVLVATSSSLILPTSSSTTSHYVAAILVTFFVCIVIAAVYFYTRNRKVRVDLFQRLEASSRRVSGVSDVIGGRRPSNASGVFAYSRDSGLRFLNPIFNQSMASLVGAGLSSVSNDNAPTPPTDQVEGQHENPMYAAYQSMSPEEQQASEEAQRAREMILDAAGQMVATIDGSQVHYKESKLSTPSGNDLGVITEEEKEAKQEESNLDDTLVDVTNESTKREDNMETDITKDSTLDTTINQEQEQPSSSTSPQEASVEVQSEDTTDQTALTLETPKEEEEKERDDSKGTEIPITQVETVGTDHSALLLSAVQELDNSNSSSSTEDEVDTTDVLTNLEGFSPLVGMKFKK
ncbi:hypothetical protein Pmani_013656 [Petrolisthes manimaculis]|uniref:Protein amnionless n=1 Tax=Petrolisthes manimaculis TaxID=1843537 RepID=A0AAE1UDV9_9EUCA|nr:hypothetical protein Pmani_013656 [Petrolisthes manimaculis]